MSAIRRAVPQGVLLVLAAVIVLLGVGDIVIGQPFEPEGPLSISGMTLAELEEASPEAYRVIDFKARAAGVMLVALGILLLLVTWFAYRPGQRWAWFAMWVLPAWALSVVALPLVFGLASGQSVGSAAMSGPVLAAIAAVALLVDRRRFSAR